MKKISESKVEEFTVHRREFQLVGASTGTGFSFPCDASGEVVLLSPEAKENFELAVSSPEYKDIGVQSVVMSQKTPALWVCCETEFALERFTNTCPDCGVDYNGSGSRLAPRSQWGEETGESLMDILNEDAWGDW